MRAVTSAASSACASTRNGGGLFLAVAAAAVAPSVVERPELTQLHPSAATPNLQHVACRLDTRRRCSKKPCQSSICTLHQPGQCIFPPWSLPFKPTLPTHCNPPPPCIHPAYPNGQIQRYSRTPDQPARQRRVPGFR